MLKIKELIDKLELAYKKHGDIPIYFDTEARTFEYHMALIGSANINEEPEKHISLHEV